MKQPADMKKHQILYVADVTIPLDDPRNGANQRMHGTRTLIGMFLFCVFNKETWASVKAKRYQLIKIRQDKDIETLKAEKLAKHRARKAKEAQNRGEWEQEATKKTGW